MAGLTPSFRACGGDVLMGPTPLPFATAERLFGWYARNALEAEASGDLLGAKLFARSGVELGEAIQETQRWRRAA